MRRAGRVVAEMHERTRQAARPGATTADLDRVAREVLERRDARSNFLNYHGFPAVICTSPNDMIVHGIPGGYRLKEGDILSIDCGAIIEGYHADAAFTMAIGDAGPEALKLIATTEELAKMRRAGKVVAEMHEVTREAAKPGVTTRDLDKLAREVLDRRGARSNFLNYHGFPAVICTSPNDMIVHGIPGDYRLKDGDIISIDCGAIIEGYHGDAAFTMGVGEVDPAALRLIEVTEASLFKGIEQMVDGNRLSDIGHAVQTVAEGAGFSVVREYVGHAIGTAMHEEPQVPNYGPPGKGPKLRVGMVFAVEPMVNMGGPGTRVLDDGWSVMTADGSLSSHAEHTIAITDNGPEVLTILS